MLLTQHGMVIVLADDLHLAVLAAVHDLGVTHDLSDGCGRPGHLGTK